MNRRKVFGLAVLSVALASASCSGKAPGGSRAGNPGNERRVETVTLLSSVGAYKEMLESEIASWNATVGKRKRIIITIETNSANYNGALDLALESGKGPDLFNMATAARVMAGSVASLDGIEEVQETLDIYRKDLIPGQNVINGKIYSVPQCIYPIKFIYNKDLFKKSGMVDARGEARPPKTLEEMVEDARIITRNGKKVEYGYGLTFAADMTVRRLMMKPFIMTTGRGWFDNAEGEYRFEPFAELFSAFKRLINDGSVFPGYETISIDAIRAQFSEGRIGMMCSPSYDIGVITTQFPARCDWAVCDFPQAADPATSKYKGVGYIGNGVAIGSSVSEDRMWAVAEAWNFLNGVELNAKLYATGNIIPSEESIIEYSRKHCEFVEKKNWDAMADLTYYAPMPAWPDMLLSLEGDDYQSACRKYFAGELALDELIAGLDKRYNAAYRRGVAEGRIIDAYYHYSPRLER